ncbi:hypothetical protein DFS34DRAFT_634957 [Phlyctochytrium arcticum]|nr:hypothetical protein DFS34DRAFT_634957 [Phlyctochytrium arcticum]
MFSFAFYGPQYSSSKLKLSELPLTALEALVVLLTLLLTGVQTGLLRANYTPTLVHDLPYSTLSWVDGLTYGSESSFGR